MAVTHQSSALRPRTRAFGLIAIIGLMLSLLAAPLAAQDAPVVPNQPDFEVLRVDLRSGANTVVLRPGPSDPDGEVANNVQVTIEGNEQSVAVQPIHRSRTLVSTVLIVDNSENADAIAGFDEVRSAAISYLSTIGASTRVMLVEAGNGSADTRAVVPFTTNHAAVRDALDNMRVGSGAVTWNAVNNSVSAFAAQGDGIRNVVAFIGSPGGASSVTAEAAKGSLLSTNATFTVVAPQAENLNVAAFTDVATAVRGGAFFRGTPDVTLSDAGRLAAEAHESVVVATIDPSSVQLGSVDVEGTSSAIVSFRGNTERVRIVPAGLATGAGLLAPPIIEQSRFAVLQGSNIALIGIALAVVATLLFSFSMMQIFTGADNSLNSTLSVYGSQDRTEEQRAADEAFQSQRSKIIEQVVERAEEAAASRGDLTSTTSMLEKAEIPLRVGEAMAIQIGLIIGALLLGFLISGGNPFVALLFAIPAATLPMVYIKLKVKRRSKKLEAQLPDTLNLLASTLKAGYSFVQGIDAVGNEAEEPLAGEFRRTVNEARLGKDLDLALDDLAERVDSVDLLWAIVAIKIQREVGGNLAELLSTVADTMTSRSRLRGEVSALTAEGRMSAIVLLLLPFGVGAAMYFMNKPYISTLWTNTLGYVAMGIAGVSMVAGALWMRKIIDIEI